MGTPHQYVHGYSVRESLRLQAQASTLEGLLHADTSFPAGSLVLEAGCGIAAQTVPLAKNSPEAQILAVDISATSLSRAAQTIRQQGIKNVRFVQADLYQLPFKKAVFDHIFLCFVLEHVADPVKLLARLKATLAPGGTLTVIEGDHGSAYFYPRSADAMQAILCQIKLQARAGGDAQIGRQLFPLCASAGYQNIRVSPRMVYVDRSHPELAEGFTKHTFTAMIEGIREEALREGMIDRSTMDRGIQALYRTAAADGVFCYTFFKAFAKNNPE